MPPRADQPPSVQAQSVLPLLSINNLYCRYPNNTSITIEQPLDFYLGDVVLLSGKSGCGKSTFFHILKGLIPTFIPSMIEGDICYNGVDLLPLPLEQKSSIALLWQNPEAQFISSNAYQELALTLENLGMAESEMMLQLEQIAKNYALSHLLHKKVHELSSGEKQKINLLALLLNNPKILLLDEPTAFLDQHAALSLVKLLEQIAATKLIIIIEHNINYFTSLINKHLTFKQDLTRKHNQQLVLAQLEALLPSQMLQPSKLDNSQILQCNSIPNAQITYLKQPPLLVIKHYQRPNYYSVSNFNVYSGEIIGIIGDNGIGKSRLLQVIGKFAKTTQGSIYYNGVDINLLADYWQKVTLLLQNSEQHFIYPTVLQELPNQQLLAAIGLADKIGQSPFTLSFGEKRRLAIAIICSQERELYLLDEPTVGQDAVNKEYLRQLLVKMQQNGKTLIIVSHDWLFLQTISSRIITFTDFARAQSS